ncbi:two-component system, sensor histidine kinase FlrB [Colwellia chukchiensis]|uniref:histidine kinase n=1 Tax=Colwellia chukchiensis TaxID=641665 RepID=A0A1H7HFZ7_9GAMM|nr:ATP-binding protein [Colwellia chukchiensis]SEK49229.1 two-component system, sensor histidine kinase FlrB [Colwellia chukchiensis]
MAFAFSTANNAYSANPIRNADVSAFARVTLPPEQSQALAQENFAGELALLRQQNQQLQHVIDVMPTGMIMLNGDGIVVKMNNTAQQLLDEPILGQAWFDVIKRSFKPRADDWHEVSLNDGRRVKLEITALGEQPGQLIMITDLTETRLLQDKLSQLQRLSSLGRMVSKLAHQIRTPLSAAMLYGANLRNQKLAHNARENFQDKLMLRLHDLEQQVNDMLLFAKSGQQAVVEPVNINHLITQAKQAIEAQVSQANAQVNLHFCQQDCEVLGNANALSGAIQNLIHNSLSVIKADAIIDISAYCRADFTYISVRDNGPGISSELADKIFEPFYTSRSQGTGLGLAVVKSVTNAHQGEVSLLSKPGEGAHFCIKIPKLCTNKAEQKNTINENDAMLSKEFTNEHK